MSGNKRNKRSRGANHHRTQKGRRVRVVKRCGEEVFGRFKEENHRYCLLEPDIRIPWKDILKFHNCSKSVLTSLTKGRRKKPK